ncbi:MAG: MerR family transcriptional regulator [Clostridia bacterium]|nr:MerR family transcriptional regulator [Clostridia bacterium]
MKMHIKEFAELTGVSVRTLHYYDEIGLLKPASVEEHNGYRFYDEKSVERMQEILFYRELDFELKSISEILSSPNYDKRQALSDQKRLLILKKERLERLIGAIDLAEKGTVTMNAFDNTDYETARKQYEAEAKQKWGDTDAYKEHEKKTAGYTKDKWQQVNDALNAVLAKFGERKNDGYTPDASEIQALVKELQNHITENYYTCTDQILACLGQMYVADERFKNNIDKNASGTAEFVAKAIEIYCK